MVNGCVKGQDDCGCDCHRVPGVVHVRACCDKPPASRWRNYPKESCDCWEVHSNLDLTEYSCGCPCHILAHIKTFDTNRDPGDESDSSEQK